MWRTTSEVANRIVNAVISIHVPRVEDDVSFLSTLATYSRFQSTSPVWRTTMFCKEKRAQYNISIHVPRVEDDERNLVGRF